METEKAIQLLSDSIETLRKIALILKGDNLKLIYQACKCLAAVINNLNNQKP